MHRFSLFFTALFLTLTTGQAMTLNVPSKYGDRCSPPQTPFLTCYSRQSAEMLFNSEKEIEIICQAGLRALQLKWTLHRDTIRKPFLTGTAKPLMANDFRITIPTKDLVPGFYTLRLTLDTGITTKTHDKLKRRPVQGVCTFGWRVNKMAISNTRPKDFKAFWAKAKQEIDAIPLDAKYETPMKTFKGKEIDEYNLQSACLPAAFNPAGHKFDEVESCKVSFAGPDGGRVYGYLAKPKGKGPFPVMLVLPGAGVSKRPRPLEQARHGYLALDIQVHGHDVDLEKYPKVTGYYSKCTYEPINKFYFYNIHKRVMQAVNYLASHPDADTSEFIAAGGSQGGRLSIVIAGLDPRITATVACITNSPNEPHLSWINACNKAKKSGIELKGAPPVEPGAKSKCFAYYDPMNYAPDITCPVLMNSGLIDPISPPCSVWAVYNRLTTNTREMIPLPGLGHDWTPEFDRYAYQWLKKQRKNSNK